MAEIGTVTVKVEADADSVKDLARAVHDEIMREFYRPRYITSPSDVTEEEATAMFAARPDALRQVPPGDDLLRAEITDLRAQVEGLKFERRSSDHAGRGGRPVGGTAGRHSGRVPPSGRG